MSSHASNVSRFDSLAPAVPMSGAYGEEIRLELVSKTAYLCAVRSMISAVCNRLSFNSAQASQIVLAVDEALANVIKHGYSGREDGKIVLFVCPFSISERGPGIRIIIEDNAKQVDPSAIKSRDLDDVRPGGLGVHIIQRVMDSVQYEKRGGSGTAVGSGGGMKLTLIKYLSSPAVSGDGLSSGEACCGGGKCDMKEGEKA